MDQPKFANLVLRLTAAVGRPNRIVVWDDGHDHEDVYAVVLKTDISDIILANQRLIDEVVRLTVVESIIDAVEAAVQRAKQGHGELNESVLSGLVDTYRKVLTSD